MLPLSMRAIGQISASFLLVFAEPRLGQTESESNLFLTGFAGVMTDDVWEEAIQFWQADFQRSGFVGVAFGQDVVQVGRLSFGYEGQIVAHFGEQDNLEINLPLVVRYRRKGEIFPMLQTMAFGLGVSWASEAPKGEVRRKGESTNTLIYWMAELQLDIPQTDLEGVVRLHHRSNAFGLIRVDSGSNAWVVGVRKRF